MTSLGPRLAEGRTAEIYAWGEGEILKLFRDWVSPDDAAHEARVGRIVRETGLPVPAVGDVVEVGGRLGLVYERVEGVSMARHLWRRPWALRRSAHLLAQLHAEMHEASVGPGLPSQQQRLEWKIGEAEALPDDLRRAALESLAHMPDGDALCHGDFHPENVLMGKKGPVIIDWIDATCGNPLADVARTLLILSEATRPDSSLPRRLKTLGRWLHRWYCARYFRLRPGRRDELPRWRPIVAAARLSENIEGSKEWLLSLAETGQA